MSTMFLHWTLTPYAIYTVAGLAFAPDARGGTSNQALGPVQLRMDGPGMLVIVPRGRLDVAMKGLLAANAWGSAA